ISNGRGFAVARFNPDGTPDATFGNNGKVQTPFFHSYSIGNFSGAAAQALAIQSDGKIIAAGEANAPNLHTGFALARYNPNGSPDATFGNNGKVETLFPTESFSYSRSYVYALAMQSDGKILAGGTTDYLGSYSSFAIARYNADGSLDSTFDNDGLVKTFFGSGSISFIRSLAVQTDGKIIAAGNAKQGANYVFTLVRYNPDGSLDASFSTDGIEQTDFGSNSLSGITSVIVQNDGKIVAVGSVSAGTTNRLFAVARYNSDGSLDASFNGNGKAQTSFPYDGTNSIAIAQSITLHADGKIAAAGHAYTGSAYAVAFARYNSDGSPDITLGENGKVFGVSNVPIAGMTITSTRVYAAGSTKYYGYLGAVAAFNYNAAPILAAIGNKKASAGGVLSFKANGTDADIPVQPLSYSISFLPNGASFNQTTGDFSWTPSASQSGDYVTTFSVTDGIATDEETITITVNKPSPRLAPVIETYAPHSGPVGTLVTLTGTGFTDITGVTFNGVSAAYTVIDSTTITTTVPVGATTGKISVSNANGTAYSRGKFTVPGTGPGNNRTVLTSVTETIKEVMAAPITLSVKALPNPAPHYFTLVIQTSNKEPISINVRDASGKLIERRSIETPRTLRIGNEYRTGVYFVDVIQGRERVTIKLIKSGR
ncbi:MAG TPA: putative Ig domain-containing protein, partial [Chitinophagaceae bacterium]